MTNLKWRLWSKWVNIIIEHRVRRWHELGGNVLYHGNREYWEIQVRKKSRK